MTRSSTTFGLLACLLLAAPVAAQTGAPPPRITMPRQAPSMPPRDTSARPTTPTPDVGTASLSGRVVAADTGQPLRKATVSAMPTRPPDMPRPGGSFQIPRSFSARTDEDGRFTIAQVPAGEYNLTARRAGYVETSFGQMRTNGPSRRITVADGAAVARLDFQLARGGVITGRVLDEGGEPAERVSVRALQQRRMGGQMRFMGGQGDQTDDQGHYRIYGLPPGEYVVMAEPGDQRGPFAFGGGNVQGLEVDTIPTYGPGTVNPAEAMKVQVQPGVEAAMDVQLVVAKVATVRGRALTSKGEPMEGGFVRLQTSGSAMMGMGKGGPLRAGGAFEIPGVAPGTYMVIVQPMMRGGFDDDGPAPESAMESITVEGEDVVVSLTASVGSTARGRVVVEGDASALANRELRIMSFATSGDMLGMGVFPGRGRMAADQTFEVSGLRGQQALSVQGLPEGWWVKDVRVAGESALDGFDFGQSRAFTGVEIVVSTRPTGLTGTVTLPTGATAGDYAVVLFPEDDARWERLGMGQDAGLRITRPGLDGAFRLPGVRPGSYYALAVPADQAEYQALSDPDQLRALAGRARTVEVKDGQMTPLSLTLVER
ncbi:carboxypeptidase regulatory-like domain-containing protein [Luteitalea sp.]